MKFSNAVYYEIRNCQSYVFNSMQIFDVLYNKNSENRTPILEDIMQREAFSVFANKLQIFRNGGVLEPFADIYFIKNSRSKDLSELCEYFASVIDDFKETYDDDDPYYSYSYAVLLVSIVKVTVGYFPPALLFNFMHFCRRNSILKI